MIYNDFKGLKLSALGFGAMRLPLKQDKSIDGEQTREMVRLAMESGVNYFDTAYPYHGGMSEIELCKALSEYPRDSYYLADKYPGHQIADTYYPAEIFEEQLKKCGTDHFDFYLLHNVYEKCIDIYLDPKWGILDYFLEQKKNGRIRHLGFSAHARPENLKRFLDACGEHMEFCQIQLNYIDWELQEGEKKVAMLKERGIPVWVMEPLRGGKLVNLPESVTNKLSDAGVAARPVELAFRFLQGIDNVTMILSGMSSIEQMRDNIGIFAERKPLTAEEKKALDEATAEIKKFVPCTGCHYCDGCPKGLDIPLLLQLYNDLRFSPSMFVTMQIESLGDAAPHSCIGCGSCERKCPQSIEIPKELASFAEMLDKMPSWAQICEERNAAAKRAAMK